MNTDARKTLMNLLRIYLKVQNINELNLLPQMKKVYREKSPKFSLSFNKIILFSADYAVCNSKKNNFIIKQVAERL